MGIYGLTKRHIHAILASVLFGKVHTMDTYKLRVKIGPHEFEAEGPPDAVRTQFEEFKNLVGSAPPPSSKSGQKPDTQSVPNYTDVDVSGGLDQLFAVDNKRALVSLKFPPHGKESTADAAVLILYGFKMLLGKDDAPVSKLITALEQSGCSVKRLDRDAAKYLRESLIIKGGRGRGGRYRLANQGIRRAQELVEEFFQTLV